MGQTLTHGVYLPDEGERNCYNGLAANWSILDGAVGTIAEHSTQISGKAPLVHTHSKSDITDFPAYGNTAGTICEGNDSRLSDARTPVAHTHTKSDVTDLFNSVNTWTGNNFFPLTGLYLRGFSARASAPASNEFSQCNFADNTNSPLMSINSANRVTGVRDLTFRVYTSAGGTNGVGVFKDASDNYSFCSLDPNNTIELGTPTNKWKTLNGVNPGALSLPNLNYSDSNQWIDLSGNITQLTGGDNWYYPNVDGWVFVITSNNPVSLNVLVLGAANSGKLIAGASGVLETVSGAMWVSAPAPAGSRVRIRANNGSTGTIEAAWFITCQGNV